MGRIALILAIVAVIGVLWARSTNARRKKEQQPELNKHPERLDQMLDPTDDA